MDFLEHLPSTAAYHAALAQDEELAREVVESGDESAARPRPPDLTEWGPDVQVLAEVRDLLASLLVVTVRANGGKPPKPKPYPRPETALQRVKRRTRVLRHSELVRRVLPGRSE
ncbi:MAG TPA: hypothetical protein VF188_08015 [Longimicrobiales bacterium]